MTHTSARRRPRRGFTLAELLIALAIVGITGGVVMSTVIRQQRFSLATSETLRVRAQLWQALTQLPADLRQLAPREGDIYLRAPNAIEFRSVFGSAVLCAASATGDRLIVPPTDPLQRRNRLATWLQEPVAGDSVLVYDEGVPTTDADNVWRRYELSQVRSVRRQNGCGGAGGMLTPTDSATLDSYELRLSTPIPVTVLQGAPVRVFRRVRYEMYVAADGNTYLGHYACGARRPGGAFCDALTPAGGPYSSYTAGNPFFTYYDSTGAVMPAAAPSANVRAIRIHVRGQSTNQVRGFTGGRTILRDSLALTVSFRNAS